jgi:hypothetical protein
MKWRLAVTQEPSCPGRIAVLASAQEQMLYWVDIPGRKILPRQHLHGAVQAGPCREPGCIAPAASGGSGGGAARRHLPRAAEWGGACAGCAHRPRRAHHPLQRRQGRPAGPLLGRHHVRAAHAAEAALYCLDCHPQRPPALQVQRSGASHANGLAWSPDGATMYWADTQGHVIHAWDCDAQPTCHGPARVFHELAAKPPGWQPGHAGLWRPARRRGGRRARATTGAPCLKVLACSSCRQPGEMLADYAVPARCPTMPCFGGDDLRTLYLTTARHGRPKPSWRNGRNRAACCRCGSMCRACPSTFSATDFKKIKPPGPPAAALPSTAWTQALRPIIDRIAPLPPPARRCVSAAVAPRTFTANAGAWARCWTPRRLPASPVTSPASWW